MKLHINNIVELLSLMVAILYYPYLKGSFMKWFLPFLSIIVVGELIANYQYSVLNKPAVAVNYFICIAETVVYGYIFYKLSHKKSLKKVILIFIPLSVLSYVFAYLFEAGVYKYFFYVINISGFFLVVISLAYLYTKFDDDDDDVLLVSEPGFWIAFGVTLFYSGNSISFALHDFISKNNLSFLGQKIYVVTPRVLSVILYLSISIAIILCKQKKKILS